MTRSDYRTLLRQILRDIQVELADEFDRNFERQGFFSESWKRRKGPLRQNGHILVDSGALRRSIRTKRSDTGVEFTSDLPYASIHNDGGSIKVTARMKRFFWARYYAASGSFGRRKDGSLRRDRRTVRLVSEAEFWKLMALKPVGSEIRIPKRQFIGNSPEVERSVTEIIEQNIEQYFNDNFDDEVTRIEL